MPEQMDIVVASLPDGQVLVAEVYCGGVQWAELNTENGSLTLEIYPSPDGGPWVFDYSATMDVLSRAKHELDVLGPRRTAGTEE